MTSGLYTQNYNGCISNLVLNYKKIDLMADAIDGRNVRPCDSWKNMHRKFFKLRKHRAKKSKYVLQKIHN